MTGRKKILFVEYFPFMGGGQAVLLNIIEAIKKHHEVEALIFNRGLIEPYLKKLGVKTHFIKSPDKVKYRYIHKYMAFYKMLTDFLRRENYDLIYSGGMFATKLAGPACFMLGIPLIWHKQLIIEKGYFSYNASQARFLSNFASKIICVSDASRLSMIKAGVNTSKLVTVHNGIKMPSKALIKSRSKIRAKYRMGSDFVCGTVCIFRLNKGLDLLIKAAALIQQKGLPIKFILAGKADRGQEWFEEKIRKQAKELGLKNFIFAGYGDKYSFMPAFDLYVMSSPNEPFGLVTIEAMALGIPAVGFAKGGTKEIISDGKDGLLINELSAGALAEKIIEAYNNRKKLRAMSKESVNKVNKSFNIEKQMDSIKEIIESQFRHKSGGQMKISAVIICKNEERIIARCLASVQWCDEILVVDSGSTDNTVSIAKKYGAKVIYKKWTDFARQKNFAMSNAKGPWLLSLDADEVVSDELRDEIQGLIRQKGGPVAYDIPRKNFYYGGRFLKFGTVYPDATVQDGNQGPLGWYTDMPVHQFMKVDGRAAMTKGALLHYSKPDLESHLNAINSYTGMEAKKDYDDGRRATGYSVIIKPLYFFIRRYFFKLGMLDGYDGFLYHIISSAYVFLHELKLLEMDKGVAAFDPWPTIFKKSKK